MPTVRSAALRLQCCAVLLLLVPALAWAQGNGNGKGTRTGNGGGGVTPDALGNGIAVAAIPSVHPSRLPSSGPWTAFYTVSNTKTSAIPVTFSCATTGPLTCSSPSPGSAIVPGNGSVNVTVNYSSTSGTGPATVGLVAELDVGTPPTSTGEVDVGVYAAGKPGFGAVAQAQDNLDHGLCFVTGAGEGGGLACGDLFLTEGMPAFTTMGKDRSPTLYYNSATATGLRLLPVWYTQPVTIAFPTSSRLILAVGTQADTLLFTPPTNTCSYQNCSDSLQLSIGKKLNWGALPTGYYQAQLTLRNVYPSATMDSSVSVPVMVVNRGASAYGKGWSLLGVEEVLTDAADSLRRIWVAGDGSARVFRRGIAMTSGMLSVSGFTGFNATNAVDGSTTTNAWTSVAVNNWLKIDLGTPQVVTTLATYTSAGTAAAAFNIQYSDNATTWTTVFASFKPVTSGWRRVVWSEAGAHRYWRLVAATAGGPTVSELSLGGANTFYGAPGEAPDSLVRFDSTGGKWLRQNLKHGASVVFDPTGVHRQTTNRTGQRTRFVWSGTPLRLDSIVIPPNDAIRAYKLRWNGSSGLLDSLTDPAGRSLRTVMTSGKLVKVVSPGHLDSTRFAYDGRGVIIARNAARQHLSVKGDSATTKYTYANAARVTKVEIQADSAGIQFQTTTIAPWDEGTLAAPALLDSLGQPTTIDGPIAGTGDKLEVRVDRFGAPLRLKHLGLNTITRIFRDSSQTLPALVTKVHLPHPSTAGATGRIVRLSWNDRGNLVQQRDSSSHLGTIGLPTHVMTYTDGSSVPAAYDSPTQVADALGRTSTYVYTSSGLTQSVTDPRSHQTQFSYVASGALTGLVDSVMEKAVKLWPTPLSARDVVDAFEYDAQGNVSMVRAPNRVKALYQRDVAGNPSAVWNYAGLKTAYTRDSLGRILTVARYTTPLPIPGGLNLLLNCDTGITVCADTGRAVSSGIGNPVSTTYVHSPQGLTTVWDARSVTRGYRYDARGAIREEIDSRGNGTVASFNVDGTLSAVTLREGHTVNFTYDAYGRRSAMLWPSVSAYIAGDTISYGYDLTGQAIIASGDHADVATQYFANGALRLVVSNGDTLRYTYDAAGARKSFTVRELDGVVDSTRYSYNASGDLDSLIVKWGGVTGGLASARVFRFEWDELGRRKRVTYPLGSMSVNYTYDAMGVMRTMRVLNAPVPPVSPSRLDLADSVYAVDAEGRALDRTLFCKTQSSDVGHACGAQTTRPTHSRFDRLGWLASQWALPSSLLDRDSLRYDASGNIVWRRRDDKQPQTFVLGSVQNMLERMDQPGDSSLFYSYNLNGDRFRDGFNVQGMSYKDYYYDGRGRLNGIINFVPQPGAPYYHVSGETNLCKYDAVGRQVRACAVNSPYLRLDGQSIYRADLWRIRGGPGLDDPLVSLFRSYGATAREVYHVTD